MVQNESIGPEAEQQPPGRQVLFFFISSQRQSEISRGLDMGIGAVVEWALKLAERRLNSPHV